jgi:hypothetical protein
MKNLKLFIVALFISTISFAQIQDAKEVAAPVTKALKTSELKWKSELHDFGTIEKGKPVTYAFTFKNTTKETVLITAVQPSCGCTAANYTKTPIKPGETGTVEAIYNAATPGNFQKTISVTTNEQGASPKTLNIKGKVEATIEK